jgi:glc operon protein GlcG
MAPQLISFDMAKRIVDAAEAASRANNWNMTIVVVDAAGVPIYLRRLPNSAARSYTLATGKAQTVVASKMSTEAYRLGVAAGTVTAIPDAVTFSGGIPVLVNGEFAGAIGVSGSSQENDVVVAEAGLAAMGN